MSKKENIFKISILSFIIPIVIYIFSMIILQIYPFGPKSILTSDLNNIIVDFILGAKNNVLNKDIFYAYNLGLGTNQVGVFAFGFGGIFSSIFFLFKNSNVQNLIFFLLAIRIGLCGITFSIFLKKIIKKTNLGIVIFSCCYALMNYNLIYGFLFMWLDGVILLPLVTIGIYDFYYEKKYKLLCIASLLSLFSSFYTSYMLIFASAIFYTYLFILDNGTIFLLNFLKKVLNFIKIHLFIFALSAVFMLPYLFSIINGSTGDDGKLIPHLKFGISAILKNFFIASFASHRPNGSLLLYCGIICIILIIFSFFNKKIDINEKKGAIFILLISFFSFFVSIFYLIWHGLDNPDWFEGRFSFCIMFFIIFLAAKSYFWILDNEESLSSKYLYIFPFLFLIYFVDAKVNKFVMTINIIFILIYMFLLKNIKTYKKKNIAVLIVTIVELSINAFMVLKTFDRIEGREDYKYFLNYKESESLLTKGLKDNEPFYRIESTTHRRENDLYGIDENGISIFCSFYNSYSQTFLQRNGISSLPKLSMYEGSTPFLDSLLGIRYIINPKGIPSIYNRVFNSFEEKSEFYDVYQDYPEVAIYKNNNFFGIGCIANKELKSYVYKSQNPFKTQNEIYKNMSGLKENIYENYDSFSQNIQNLEVGIDVDKLVLKKIDQSQIAFIDFIIKNETDKQIFANFYVFNGEGDLESQDIMLPRTYGVFQKNIQLSRKQYDRPDFKIRLLVKSSEMILDKDMFYYSIKENFDKQMSYFIKNKVEILSKKGSKMRIKANVNNTENNILFTSIPFDKGWHIKVDGKKVKPLIALNAFIGVDLPSKKNTYEIEMKYVPPGLYLGMVITSITIILFLLYYILKYKR